MHDEFVIEVPDEGGLISKEVVDRNVSIVCEEMASVLHGDIPVVCEATVSTCSSKDARLIVRDGKVVPWSPGLEATPCRTCRHKLAAREELGLDTGGQ
jgi:hypothetical protein